MEPDDDATVLPADKTLPPEGVADLESEDPAQDRRGWTLSGQLRSISGQLGAWPTGARARLRRMDPESPGRGVGDVIALLMAASVPADQWQDRRGGARSRGAADERLIRWARVCHLMATLAGAAGREVHAPVQERENGRPKGDYRAERQAGRAIHASGYSEHRLTRLTSARGSALADQARRLARFLAAAGTLPADLTPVAELLLFDGEDVARTDRARLDLARAYYRAAFEADRARTGTKGTS